MIRRPPNQTILDRIAARADGGELKIRDERIRELEDTLERIQTLSAVRSNGGEVGRLGVIQRLAAQAMCPLKATD